MRWLAGLPLLAPAAATLALGLRAGGFFPGTTAWLAVALALALVLYVTLARAPFAGWTPALSVAAGALGALACWTLASAEWSGAPARALLEFDRTLAYLLVVVLAGAVPRHAGQLAAILRWTAFALAALALAGVLSRLLPDLLPTELGFDPARLGFPVTYWNALGVLCAVGAVLLVGVSASEEEPAWARTVAAAAVPAVAAGLLLTFSRGGVVAALLGLGVLVLARPARAWLTALPVLALPTGALVLALLEADRVTSAGFAAEAAAGERRTVLLVLAGCMLAAAGLRALTLSLDGRLARRAPGTRGRRTRLGLGVAAAASAVLLAVAADVPAWVDDQRRAFAAGDVVPITDDPASRLTQVGNNGRLALWDVALDEFRAEPWHGTGAGTYRLAWQRERPEGAAPAVDAHSLYLEVLAELGVPGLLLLLTALVALLVAVARGLRGPERAERAALLGCAVALLVHAGVDWDWEMPVLWVWLLAAAACAAARSADAAGDARGLPRVARVLAGLAVLFVALTPLAVARSQGELARAGAAFERGDCAAASAAALASLSAQSSRPEPLALLGYCDVRAGAPELAVRAMQAAVARDPDAWEYRYGLALALAVAGADPRPTAADALALNPREPLAQRLVEELGRRGPRGWPRAAERAAIPRQ